MTQQDLLLIPDKPDPERDTLAKAWVNEGGAIKRIGKFWLKPEVENAQVSLYGYDSFCLVLAQVLDLKLVMPMDEIIAALPTNFTKRKILIKPLSHKATIDFPKFIKPVVPKLFKASIYHSIAELTSQVKDVAQQELIICSEIITIEKEVRSFILDRVIQDLAFYEGDGELSEAKNFIHLFLNTYSGDLPRTFVLDIGYNTIQGWFIIEFNACWGAGLNFCQPEKVIPCIQAATYR